MNWHCAPPIMRRWALGSRTGFDLFQPEGPDRVHPALACPISWLGSPGLSGAASNMTEKKEDATRPCIRVSVDEPTNLPNDSPFCYGARTGGAFAKTGHKLVQIVQDTTGTRIWTPVPTWPRYFGDA